MNKDQKEALIQKAIELIRSYWMFDNNQVHAHNWHDREDCIIAIEKLLNESVDQERVPVGEMITKEQVLKVIGWLYQNNHLCNLYFNSDMVMGFLSMASQISNELNTEKL
jgi:hypothetical protein